MKWVSAIFYAKIKKLGFRNQPLTHWQKLRRTARARRLTLGFRWLIKLTIVTAASRGLTVVNSPRTRLGMKTHALPFFEFIRSHTSRLRARSGSKFWGSHALSGRSSAKLVRSPQLS